MRLYAWKNTWHDLAHSNRCGIGRTQLMRVLFVKCHSPKKVKAVDMREVNDNQCSDQAFKMPDFTLAEWQSVLHVGGMQNS